MQNCIIILVFDIAFLRITILIHQKIWQNQISDIIFLIGIHNAYNKTMKITKINELTLKQKEYVILSFIVKQKHQYFNNLNEWQKNIIIKRMAMCDNSNKRINNLKNSFIKKIKDDIESVTGWSTNIALIDWTLNEYYKKMQVKMDRMAGME